MTPRRAAAVAAWSSLAAASAWATWAAWTGPGPQPPRPTPPALPRPPTPAERAALREAERRLQREILDAAQALGHPPAADALEGRLPDGRPVLPSGLPDNPLMPLVAAVEARCPPAGPSVADWLYCPETGEVAAVLPDDAASSPNR